MWKGKRKFYFMPVGCFLSFLFVLWYLLISLPYVLGVNRPLMFLSPPSHRVSQSATVLANITVIITVILFFFVLCVVNWKHYENITFLAVGNKWIWDATVPHKNVPNTFFIIGVNAVRIALFETIDLSFSSFHVIKQDTILITLSKSWLKVKIYCQTKI